MAKKKSVWLKIISESAMIVFSILLALFINEWRNNYHENVQTSIILENIKAEIKENQKFVKELIAYHEKVRDDIQSAFSQDSLEEKFFPNLDFVIYRVAPDGIIQGDLSNIAWTVAKEDKITNRISLDKAKVLFETYEQQETVNQTIDRIIAFISTREIQRKELLMESVIVFGTEINELVGQEKNLNYRYEQTLKALDSWSP